MKESKENEKQTTDILQLVLLPNFHPLKKKERERLAIYTFHIRMSLPYYCKKHIEEVLHFI